MKESVIQQRPVARRTTKPAGSHPAYQSYPVAGEAPRSLIKRLRWPLTVLLLGGLAWGFSASGKTGSPALTKPSPVKMVTIQTPPPPPPPLSPPPPKIVQQEPKMIEQTPVNEEEPKPDEPKPADDPPADIGTGIKGDGPPDGFGLSGNRGSRDGGRGLAGSGAARSRWGWYAAKVQSGISEALRRDPRLRESVLNGKIRIWPDATGRITRASLDGSTGDAALDAAVTRALTGVQLSEPPPADMPAPILLRINARRP